MEVIRGVGPLAGQAGTTRQARGASGFRLPQVRAPVAGPVSGAEAVGLAGMLALQELPDGDPRDREARRRGQDLLAALAEMQRAMLGMAGGDAAGLERLAANVPVAGDPVLREVVAAIALRARVEAARLAMRPAIDSQNSIEPS